MTEFTISKHSRSRFWAVRDPVGELVCLCVYKRGAAEVARRLTLAKHSGGFLPARDLTRIQPQTASRAAARLVGPEQR